MQYLDYISLRDSINNTLLTYNTTSATYDLSNSLTTRIQSVFELDPRIEPSMITEYPAIFVQLDSENSTHAEFGAGKIDDLVTINGSIHCIWDTGDKATAEENLYRMIRNVKTVFTVDDNRNLGDYSTLGAKVIDIHMADVDFNTEFRGIDSAYNKSGRIGFELNMHVKDI